MISRARFLSVVLLAGAGCLAPATERATDAGTTQQPSTGTCGQDADCPAGMVCEGCGQGDGVCLPGCRDDDACPTGLVCLHNVACTTCPCADGWCQLDPCRDVDGDGFVPSSQLALVCPGKQLGDCNDGNSRVHPGVREICANWVDDDCDGKTDAADSASCQTCSTWSDRCSTSMQCSYGAETCDHGCCTLCPQVADPLCGPGLCLLSGGINTETGCGAPAVCGDCNACPTDQAPVCGTNYGTYGNACLAAAAGVTVLHDGVCLPGEGRRCDGYVIGSRGLCASGQYCREANPAGEASLPLCTKVGACAVDADCPAGLTGTPLCSDNTIAPLVCQGGVCKVDCPQ